MAIGQVKKWLEQWNAADRVMELDLSSATVELAARALGCEEQRIAKTLSFEDRAWRGWSLSVRSKRGRAGLSGRVAEAV